MCGGRVACLYESESAQGQLQAELLSGRCTNALHRAALLCSAPRAAVNGPRAKGAKATLSDTSAEDDGVYIGVNRGQLIQQA